MREIRNDFSKNYNGEAQQWHIAKKCFYVCLYYYIKRLTLNLASAQMSANWPTHPERKFVRVESTKLPAHPLQNVRAKMWYGWAPLRNLQPHKNAYCALVTCLESSTPIISKIISSNVVHDNENVTENISCTNLWWTPSCTNLWWTSWSRNNFLTKKYPTTYEEKHLQGRTVIVRTLQVWFAMTGHQELVQNNTVHQSQPKFTSDTIIIRVSSTNPILLVHVQIIS
jgi:hypothetical protein